MKVTRVSFEELCQLLQAKETQFGMSSVEFFNRYNAGRLGDGREFVEWAGLYRVYLKMCLAQLPSEPAPQAAARGRFATILTAASVGFARTGR